MLARTLGKSTYLPPVMIFAARQFHDEMTARVLDDGEPSEAFLVTNEVKQGCVLAPTLFIMIFSAMLLDASSNRTHSIDVKYRFDGTFLNHRRL